MKRNKSNWDLPQLHADHPRPVTRRQFLSQGFMTGAASPLAGGAAYGRNGLGIVNRITDPGGMIINQIFLEILHLLIR